MKYFTFTEFERSAAAYRLGLDNTAPESARANIARLVDEVLDPIREAWGRPLTVTSGYRRPEVNKAVGGSATSHHLKGMAADITTGNEVDNRRLYETIQRLGVPFTQLIGRKYDFKWLHIGWNPNDTRHEVF